MKKNVMSNSGYMKAKMLTFASVLSIKKEKDPLSLRQKRELSLEDKAINAMVIAMGITIITFFILIVFTLMAGNHWIIAGTDLAFDFLLAIIQLVLLFFMAIFCLNGFSKNLRFIPSYVKKIIWGIKNPENFDLGEVLTILETKKGRISVGGIVWRLISSLYIAYAIFLGRLFINFLIKIAMILAFVASSPLFILKEITRKSPLLLTFISFMATVILFVSFNNFRIILAISSGLSICVLGLFLDNKIRANLFTYFIKDMYNKLKMPVQIA